MKYTTLRTVAILGLFVLLTVLSVNAQSGSRIEASIPFDFAAGEMKLKAGNYTVKRIAKDALLLRTADNKKSLIVLAPVTLPQMRNDSQERLVFVRYGSQYFLTQVWTSRAADGRGLYASKAENQLAKQSDKTKIQPQTVEVVARTR